MKFNEDDITVVFIITCVTAPVSGVIIGGIIVGKLGGYVNRKAVLFCLIASLLAGVDSLFIIIQESLVGFAVVLWFFLFFGGATIPNLLGNFLLFFDINFFLLIFVNFFFIFLNTFKV